MRKKEEKIMNPIVIDREKCVGCGLCRDDCVGGNIRIVDGKAELVRESCIRCGHCEAICPQNAVHIEGYTDTVQEYAEQVRLDPQVLLDAMKTRRSVRKFTEQQVPQEVLDLIIEAGRQAPTGTNAQGTKYVILRKKKDVCEEMAVSMFRKILNIAKKLMPGFGGMVIDDNFFFKKAPLVIIILGRDKVSVSLAAQNMAFMAEANGLGVLFSGFYTICANGGRKVRKIMGLQAGEKAVTTLVIGWPAVRYRRTVRREPAKIHIL